MPIIGLRTEMTRSFGRRRILLINVLKQRKILGAERGSQRRKKLERNVYKSSQRISRQPEHFKRILIKRPFNSLDIWNEENIRERATACTEGARVRIKHHFCVNISKKVFKLSTYVKRKYMVEKL